MKVVEIHNIGDGYDEYSGKGYVDVTLYDNSGNVVVNVNITAGEPEDAVFFRDLNGAYKIGRIVMEAYEAGRRGEPLEYEYVDEGKGSSE